jgi:hypothetical protein
MRMIEGTMTDGKLRAVSLGLRAVHLIAMARQDTTDLFIC